MDIFNNNLLSQKLWHGILTGSSIVAALLILLTIYIIINRGQLSLLNIISIFINFINLAVAIITLFIIIVLKDNTISIATLLVAILAVLELTSSATSILKALFYNRLEK